ncbi:hypothetical protein JHK86_007890 [Glycine max]|nr:hypothetical protein JHK86_007890 [Glycine max]
MDAAMKPEPESATISTDQPRKVSVVMFTLFTLAPRECEKLKNESTEVVARTRKRCRQSELKAKVECCDQTVVSESEQVVENGESGINGAALGAPRNKMELKMSKKIVINRKPMTAKELLDTGFLDGVSVVYMGGIMLRTEQRTKLAMPNYTNVQPVPAMVVVEAVASVVVVVDVVACVAADIIADDGQSKRLRVDDVIHSEIGRYKKEPDRDRVDALLGVHGGDESGAKTQEGLGVRADSQSRMTSSLMVISRVLVVISKVWVVMVDRVGASGLRGVIRDGEYCARASLCHGRRARHQSKREGLKWIKEYGFEERIKGVGLLIRGWAPQKQYPLTWPLFGEQFLNESFVVQILRIGVESQVLWGDEEKTGVLVKKEDVVRAIEKLMDEGNEREERRKRVTELAEMAKKAVEGGSSHFNVTQLIQDIMQQ